MCRFERLLAALVLALTLLSACGDGGHVASGPPLRILAGSELKDLEPMQAELERAAGVPIAFTYSGSLEAVEKLESGEQFDAVWLSHGKYLQQTESLKPRIRASERIMTSPVILGVKRSKAEALGWTQREPTWGEIAKAASDGKLNYAMTNPAASNTGFTALIGVASALAGTGDALDVKAIRKEQLTALFKGQKFIAGSSGWLADAYVERQGALDGLINYESVILQLNAGGKLKETLVPVYPKEGIITADYPLMLLEESRRESYTKLVAFLRDPGTQARISRETLRRPAVPGVMTAAAIPQKMLIELPFPASRGVLDALLETYLSELRRPASMFFVVDTSGSMAGPGIIQLKASLTGLSGDDASLTGRFARFQPREMVYLLPFSNHPGAPLVVRLSARGSDNQPALGKIRDFANALQAGGGTALFSAVQQAHQAAVDGRRKEPDRQYGIVLMTDGKNTNGLDEPGFVAWYNALPADQKGIPVFALLFGDADPAQLERLAAITGGRVFDGRKDLRTAFKLIRGYL